MELEKKKVFKRMGFVFSRGVQVNLILHALVSDFNAVWNTYVCL